ncbi:MAG: 5-formyltetrahydrofolate cyclo-ligase [Deltaproteobacteria bacterium]|nr:5-formyltetrahydrofolate cyclo-ligase [Deltaproteobacteria bacterium]
MLTKAQLRERHLASRMALSEETRALRSTRAAERVVASDLFFVAQTICLYAPVRAEADPAGIEAAALESGAVVLYPRVEGDALVFCEAARDALVPGRFGLSEPAPAARPTALAAIDLVVVPALAFDRRGHRLGYGKGYYDRALASIRQASRDVVALGFGFASQVVDRLPTGPSDQPLDALATEDALLRFLSRAG